MAPEKMGNAHTPTQFLRPTRARAYGQELLADGAGNADDGNPGAAGSLLGHDLDGRPAAHTAADSRAPVSEGLHFAEVACNERKGQCGWKRTDHRVAECLCSGREAWGKGTRTVHFLQFFF